MAKKQDQTTEKVAFYIRNRAKQYIYRKESETVAQAIDRVCNLEHITRCNVVLITPQVVTD